MVIVFLDRFVARCGGGRLLEIAPGHGTWGLLAAHERSDLAVEGVDISPTSLEFAPLLARAAGLDGRCTYRCEDATRISTGGRFDCAICSFLLEHLEDPGGFLKSLAGQIRQGGLAYVSLALTAAQPDHIFDFARESEGAIMAEAAGFDVLETRRTRPKRVLPGARFVPRVQGLVLEKA